MGRVSYGVFLWNDQPVPRIVEQVQLAEELGYESAWLLDSQLVGRELYTTMAACAVGTKRIKLGPGVTHFATRHPTVCASGFASLAELAPGRIQLGIGFGDSAIRGLGGKPTRLDDFRQGFELTRDLLQGETVPYNGQQIRLAWADPELTRQIPLYTCPGHGPKSQQLAGELGCPVITIAEAHEIERIVGNMEQGAARVGRTAKDVGFCWWANTSISNNWDDIREHLGPMLCARIRHRYYDYKRGSLSEEQLRVPVDLARRIAEEYDFLQHATARPTHARLLEQVPDDVWKNEHLVGSPEDVLKVLRRALQHQEVVEVVLVLHVDSRNQRAEDNMEAFAKHVLPYV